MSLSQLLLITDRIPPTPETSSIQICLRRDVQPRSRQPPDLEIFEEPQWVSGPSKNYDGTDEHSPFNSAERTDERSSSSQNTEPSSKLSNEPSSGHPSSFNSTEHADDRLSPLNPTDPSYHGRPRPKVTLKPSGRFLMCPAQPN